MSEMEASNGNSFMKFFVDSDRTATSMLIPPDFRKTNLKGKKSAGDLVYLRGRHDPDGATWKVDLVKDEPSSGRGLRFGGRGWLKFVKDHSICPADFAIFKFDGDETFKVTLFEPSGSEKHHSIPHIIPETEGVDDLQAAAPTTEDPSFTATMKKHNIKNYLDIPHTFVREYMKNCGERTMAVLCYGGKEWDVTMVKWKKEKRRWSFIAGWKLFARENQLNVGDTCKFQLPLQDQEPLIRFHVTISRGN